MQSFGPTDFTLLHGEVRRYQGIVDAVIAKDENEDMEYEDNSTAGNASHRFSHPFLWAIQTPLVIVDYMQSFKRSNIT